MGLELDKVSAFLTWKRLGFFNPLDILDRIFAADCQTANILKNLFAGRDVFRKGKLILQLFA